MNDSPFNSEAHAISHLRTRLRRLEIKGKVISSDFLSIDEEPWSSDKMDLYRRCIDFLRLRKYDFKTKFLE